MDMKSTSGGAGVEPLVILPGLMCDDAMFGAQIAAHDALVIGDFYGDAETIDAMAAYALARMPARAAVLGHSMGARVALAAYAMAPKRFARLALADTGLHPPTPDEAVRRYALRDLGRAEGDAALVDAWLPPMVGPRGRADAPLMARLREMTLRAGVATYTRQVEALLHRPDAMAVLPQIDCPTLVIVGRDDTWSPVAQHEEIAAAIGHAELRIVDDAGHMAPAEAPDAFNSILADWLTWPAPAIQLTH